MSALKTIKSVLSNFYFRILILLVLLLAVFLIIHPSWFFINSILSSVCYKILTGFFLVTIIFIILFFRLKSIPDIFSNRYYRITVAGISLLLIPYTYNKIIVRPSLPPPVHPFSTGALTDSLVYTEVPVKVGDCTGDLLPVCVSLKSYAPARLNQGTQGSCVGWGTSYTARTILEAVATGRSADSLAMSPSFIYNQVKSAASGQCGGALVVNACYKILSMGDVLKSDFEYEEKSCQRLIPKQLLDDASKFKVANFFRLSNDRGLLTNITKAKCALYKKNPVVIVNMVGGSFMDIKNMTGKKVWIPVIQDYTKVDFSYHCMCIIGYDDTLSGGAFQIMNSWGSAWGDSGIVWMRYSDFMVFNKEAYVMEPLPFSADTTSYELKATIGIVVHTNDYFPLTIPSKITNPYKVRINSLYGIDGMEHKIEVAKLSFSSYIYLLKMDNRTNKAILIYPSRPTENILLKTGKAYRFPSAAPLKTKASDGDIYLALIISNHPLDYIKLCNEISGGAAVNPFYKNVAVSLGKMSKAVSKLNYKKIQSQINISAAVKANNSILTFIKINNH